MAYYLGIDQGGTKTQAVVADHRGALLGVGTSDGSCYTFTGMGHATGCIRAAAEQALAQAGLSLRDVAGLAGGIAGVDYPYEIPLLSDAIRARLGLENVSCNFHNDCIGALWGGVFEPPAAVVCAGTGLNAGAVNRAGEVRILGNFCDGAYMGAGAIGKDALRAVYDRHIGLGEATLLTAKIPAFLGLSSVDELQIRQFRKKDLHGKILCPLVFEAAGEGDAVAASILQRAAKGYAGYIVASAKLVGVQGEPDLPVVTSGGVFKGRPPILQDVIARELADRLPGARLVEARYEPVVGGAVMALYTYEGGCDRGAIEESAARLGLIRPGVTV